MRLKLLFALLKLEMHGITRALLCIFLPLISIDPYSV